MIPDTQVKPGVNTDHLEWAGHYAVKMKPDVIVHIGDHWDMPSLSSYDKKGSRQMEGKRYVRTSTQVTRPWTIHGADTCRGGQTEEGKRKAWNPDWSTPWATAKPHQPVDADAQLEDLINTDDFSLAEPGLRSCRSWSPS